MPLIPGYCVSKRRREMKARHSSRVTSSEAANKPLPVSNAATDAVLAAVGIWSSVAIAAGTLFAVTRLLLNRFRAAAWQHDIEKAALFVSKLNSKRGKIHDH